MVKYVDTIERTLIDVKRTALKRRQHLESTEMVRTVCLTVILAHDV